MYLKQAPLDYLLGFTEPGAGVWGTVLPVLEAVGDQLPFGQVIQPRQLPATVSAGVKRCEALITSLQLRTQQQKHRIKISADSGLCVCEKGSHLRRQSKRAGLLERPRPRAEDLDAEVH